MPKALYKHGQRHVCLILRVDERDHRGRPSKVTVGYDDTTFHLEEGAEFLTAFVHESVLKGKAVA